MDGFDLAIVRTLEAIVQELNVWADVFKTAKQRWDAQGHDARVPNFSIRLLELAGNDSRRYNRPSTSEVAAILIDGGSADSHRDVIVHAQGGGLRRIFESHPAYDPLQNPLIFLRGELGWSRHATYREGVVRNGNSKISCREFVAYRLFEKAPDHEYSLLHRAGRLMQQWCVDQAAKILEQRLLFHRTNQATMRGALLGGIVDMVGVDEGLQRVGSHIVLSPSFTGGERYMRRMYYDAMSIVRAHGKPDLFVTMTCNPEWSDIVDNLLPGQKAQDRPDIVARVFRQKLKAVIAEIKERKIFGGTIAHLFVIEFQKRGLPHAHILIILSDESKPRPPTDYDKFVCAEIPDPERHPNLYSTVVKCMLHGPCGRLNTRSPSMVDNVCSKKYPNQLNQGSRVDGDGYPTYRRRDTRRYVLRPNGLELDNRWVVPYNLCLSARFDCHINVEICSTISSVKYLYKYVYKGQDRASVAIGGDSRDEIQQYIDARYLSAPEACWRIFEYQLQEKSHNVVELPVHKSREQYIVFPDGANPNDVVEGSKHTKLTRFFDLCANNELARTLLYHDHFVWRANHWHPRMRGGDKAGGRMVAVPPSDVERYNMCLLLCYTRGPRSYEDLLTVDGVVYIRYKDAAVAAGLLDGDEESDKCLRDATLFRMPSQLRHLFATLLVFCNPTNARKLWDNHLPAISEDIMRAQQVTTPTPCVVLQVLKAVERCLQSSSTQLSRFPDLLQLADYAEYEATSAVDGNRLVELERSYDATVLAATLSTLDALTLEQRGIYDEVIAAVNNPELANRVFFVDGPGGTGKSFLMEKLLAQVRIDGGIALAVASCGIAAQLLPVVEPLTRDSRSSSIWTRRRRTTSR